MIDLIDNLIKSMLPKISFYAVFPHILICVLVATLINFGYLKWAHYPSLERLIKSRPTFRFSKFALMKENFSNNFFEKYLTDKNVKNRVDGQLETEALKKQLEKLCQEYISYDFLYNEVKLLASTPYDPTNEEHQDLLEELWDHAFPEKILMDLKCEEWKDIGFQGFDPSTDFRSAGILAVHQLNYFGANYATEFQEMIQYCDSLKRFPMALTGIHLSVYGLELLRDNLLKPHFFNNSEGAMLTMKDFNEAYVLMFKQFKQCWEFKKPANIMDFRRVWFHFTKTLEKNLPEEGGSLKNDFFKEKPSFRFF